MPLDTKRTAKFGAATIEWDGPFIFPIAINHNRLNGDKFLITQCPVTYKIGDLKKTVWPDFLFDGASVPWYIRWIPGYSKIGWHLFAALIHDFGCDYPSEIPRPIADGIFTTLLLSIADHSKRHVKAKRRRQAWMMGRAVSLFTFIQAMKGKR